MVLHHVENRELLNSNHLIVFRIPLGRFIVIVTSLPRNLEMGLRCATGGFPATVTAFLAPQRLLRSAIEAGVLNRVPFTIRQERFEANINTDSRMSASEGRMFGLHVGLTHDQCIPMAVSPMNKMDGLGGPSMGRCSLILSAFPIFAGTCKCLLSASSQTSRLVPYWRSWIECQRLGGLKRGNPTSARPNSFAARNRLSALESRSASICTVVAGTDSPPRPLKAAVKSYFEGKVPFCSYCTLIVSSISLYRRRDSFKHCMSKRACS